MIRFCIGFFLIFTHFALSGAEQVETHLQESEQLIIVTTPDWGAVQGRLHLFERSGTKWKRKESWPIVVGRNGLAWGKGLHHPKSELPQKREGDGKAPAGIFRLSSAFGSEPLSNLRGIKMPYLPLDVMIECVDDVKSIHYNSIVHRDKVGVPDWNSSEKMAQIGEQYRLGVVVDHNVNPRKQGDGSCIFIHIWKSSTTGTAGCTAMDAKHMEKLILWLDPAKKSLLVQLPQSEYLLHQKTWQLPALK